MIVRKQVEETLRTTRKQNAIKWKNTWKEQSQMRKQYNSQIEANQPLFTSLQGIGSQDAVHTSGSRCTTCHRPIMTPHTVAS